MSTLFRAIRPIIESLENRRLLHGGHFHLDVNFQPASAVVPAGYLADGGQAFGDRGNGFSYGWDATNTIGARERNSAGDQRLDTINHTQMYGNRTWEAAVPNGQYQVTLVAGDADYFNSTYKFNVEGVLTLDGTPTSGDRFVEGMRTVTVSDGRLTITNAAGANNNKLAYVQVAQVPASNQGVSVQSLDTSAREEGQETASFDLVRTGDASLPLVVRYGLSGTASNGVDYEQLSGTATIPAGAASTTVTLAPIDDAAVESGDPETVIVTVLPDDAYSLNSPSALQISIVDNDQVGGGFSTRINFQPAGAPVPAGYLADAGLAYGARGNGLTYGWVGGANTVGLRDRNLSNSPDQRYDTLNHVNNKVWELALPNGQYNVRVVAGDAGYFDSVYQIDGEFQTSIVSGTPTSGSRWVEGNAMVWVSDGKLTISSGDGAFNNKINFIEVTDASLGTPIVEVSAHPAVEASESGASQVFTFSRTGDATKPLTVYYMTGGSATNGADYDALVSPVTFGAGVAQVDLTLAPIDDAEVEPTETATLALVPHASYTVGTSASASLRILDNDTVSGGFAAKINFQPQDAALPAGYSPDIGWSFQAQGNGLAYGWSSTDFAAARDRNAVNSLDQRYDTLTHFKGRTWDLAVPNGTYSVRIVAGDAGFFDSTYHVTAEGVSVVNGKPTTGQRWLEGTALVSVSDGRLTVASGAGAFNNKINFIEVTQADAPVGNTITWTTRAANPLARAEALRAVVDGKLYVFGGFGSNGPVSRHDVYDPATNAWTPRAPLPTRLTHAGVAVDGRDVYVAGGYVGTSSTGTGWAQKFGVTDVWKYNVDTNQWTSVTALPKEVAGGGLVLLGRSLHWVSGNNNQRQDIGDHYVLNLDAPSAGWQTAAALPGGRSHLGVVTVGGKIYAVGGQFGNDSGLTTQKLVHVWDPANPSAWTRLADMPTALGHIASATFVMGNRIITAGGETAHGSATDLVYAYDVRTNTWTSMTRLPARRFSGVAAELGGDIFFTTGSTQTTTWKGVVS